jgi:hypothetical protein
MDDSVRNPVSLSLIETLFPGVHFIRTPEFKLVGPFDSVLSAEKGLERYLFNEYLSEAY